MTPITGCPTSRPPLPCLTLLPYGQRSNPAKICQLHFSSHSLTCTDCHSVKCNMSHTMRTYCRRALGPTRQRRSPPDLAPGRTTAKYSPRSYGSEAQQRLRQGFSDELLGQKVLMLWGDVAIGIRKRYWRHCGRSLVSTVFTWHRSCGVGLCECIGS
jgi:hypothetical protein